MTDENVPATPNEELAQRITSALVAAGLIPATKVSDLQVQLASGSVKEADWLVYIEAGMPRPETDGEGG